MVIGQVGRIVGLWRSDGPGLAEWNLRLRLGQQAYESTDQGCSVLVLNQTVRSWKSTDLS